MGQFLGRLTICRPFDDLQPVGYWVISGSSCGHVHLAMELASCTYSCRASWTLAVVSESSFRVVWVSGTVCDAGASWAGAMGVVIG